MEKIYKLPELPYGYKDLEPHISEDQLKIHHQKHHQGYIDKANTALDKIQKARENSLELDLKAALRFLSFNVGGHILHSLFWNNIMSPRESNVPEGEIFEVIEKEFGSFERFKYEFSETANSVEGSGWVALIYDKESQKVLLSQIEKHNLFLIPNSSMLLVLDVWEHAYYLDYKNERTKFVESFWNIVNWAEVNKRLEETKE